MAELSYTGPGGEKRFKLSGAFSIGRTGEQSLLLAEDLAVSGNHARIEPAPGGYAITDLESRNGTFIERGGREWKISGQFTLQPGDIIRVGKTRLTYSAGDQTLSQPEEGATIVGRIVPVPRET
jgi:pSer/pThr/pTyr-binding forkhead associated (FHA) protein